MIVSVSDRLVIMAKNLEFDLLKRNYASALQGLVGQCKEYAINRDGDNFQISCPVCKTKMVVPVGGQFFVCKKKHVFSIYTEDGIVEIEEDTRILGPDLSDKGMDAHGHGFYKVFKPGDKSPIYFSCWMHEDDRDYLKRPRTVEEISIFAWDFRSRVKAVSNLSLNFYVEVDTMMGGEPVAKIGSYLRTWPSYVNNMRWFLILKELEGTDWKIGIIQMGDY